MADDTAKNLDEIVAGLIERAKEHGHLTFDALSEALPPTILSSRQIEDVLFRLNAANIDIFESPPSPINPGDLCERSIRQLEIAIAALRHGRIAHAATLLKTTLDELEGS